MFSSKINPEVRVDMCVALVSVAKYVTRILGVEHRVTDH